MGRVLVTAGPTREPIDPVRFLSNRSSGRMGYGIAQALLDAGHEVILVSGPVQLPAPQGATVVAVETAQEMLAACQQHWPTCDALFAVAAVADYRPAHPADQKLKRHEGEGQHIELVANPDIVATLAREKGSRVVVGFALETQHGEDEALRKMKAKGLDFVALNGADAQGAEASSLLLLSTDGARQFLGPLPKSELACRLVAETYPN